MSTASLSAQDVATFLKEQPDFFQEHAQIFADLRVPHPHESRAISLGERQIMTLRARNRDLEWKLAALAGNASGNEKINNTLITWCCGMLAEPDPARLPAHVVHSLSGLFGLPTIALRLWDLPALADDEFTQDVDESIKRYAALLTSPYCGPLTDQAAAAWLDAPPESLAIIAIGSDQDEPPFGLLVLGSDDAERFTADMATDFLDTIRQLASAGLQRLKAPTDFQPPERA